MKIFKYLLILFIGSSLVACGSGGSDSTTQTNSYRPKPISRPTTYPNNTNNSSTKKTINKRVAEMQKQSEAMKRKMNTTYVDPEVDFRSVNSVNNIHKINVDGKEIDLIIPEIENFYKDKEIIFKDSDEEVEGISDKWAFIAVSGDHYKNSKFGFVQQNGYGNKVVVFAQGEKGKESDLKDMRGKATYKGSVIDASTVKHNVNFGVSDIKVNFDDKTVNGNLFILGEEEPLELEISAKIAGNKFNGDIITEKTKQIHKNSTNGGFYGDSAKEIIGTYDIGTQKGSYGGVKQ